MKKRLKNKLIAALLLWIIILLLPGWVERKGWENVPGMAWIYFGLFLIWLVPSWVNDYQENQKIKKINTGISKLKKRLRDKRKK